MVSLWYGRGRRTIIGIIAIVLSFAFTALLLHTPSTTSPSRFDPHPRRFDLQPRYAVNNSLYSYPNASLVRRQNTCNWNTIAQTASQESYGALTYCEKKYVEGGWLQCMLNDATKQDDVYGWASSWTDVDSMADWGWVSRILANQDLGGKGLEAAFQGIGLDTRRWRELQQSHETSTQHNDIQYPATKADYYNFFNTQYNAIVGFSNWSPEYRNSKLDSPLPAKQITRLKQWSDLVALGLKKFGEDAYLSSDFMQNLQHVFRIHIVNMETTDIMMMITGLQHIINLPAWPGIRLSANDPKFRVLLASPNARGVAWFLGQHKQDIGVKVITHITVFKCEDVAREINEPCMYLEIADGPIADPRSST